MSLFSRKGPNAKNAALRASAPDPVLVGKVRQYLIERYERRLGQKLAGRWPVNLRMVSSAVGTSKEKTESYFHLHDERFNIVLVDEVQTVIGRIFDESNRRLLLVGRPGSGKTTLVLQLALNLLKTSEGSMAVVLNLATWRSEFNTFDVWLQQILPAELGASQGLANQIWKNSSLVLLLDGLDEIPEVDRNSCLQAIGEFGVDGQPFLISSRIDEYAGAKDAPVNAQIEVGQLTIEQVEDRLLGNTQPGSKELFHAVQNDPLLRQAVEIPFYLNTAQLLFASGKNWSEFGFVAEDVAGRQQELVERFVEGALARKIEKDYPAEKARHWLSFLASRMTRRNMVVFELRDLQYDWWSEWPWRSRFMANFINGFVGWLFFGLIGAFIIWLSIGLFSWQLLGSFTGLSVAAGFLLFSVLVSGLITGLFSGLIASNIRGIVTRDHIMWSKYTYFKLLKKKLIGGLFLGVVVATVEGMTTNGLINGLADGQVESTIGEIIIALVVAVIEWRSGGFFGRTGGVLGRLIDGFFLLLFVQIFGVVVRESFGLLFYPILSKTFSNPVCDLFIWGISALVTGSFFVLVAALVSMLQTESSDFIVINSYYQRFNASMKALHFSILQHWHIRFLLDNKNLLPIQLLTFLNEFSHRHLLETDGATWRFRHRILQDWFAERWVEEEEQKQ